MKDIRVWKKAFESDLESIIIEFKDSVTTPCVVILTGLVGAGKTTFVKHFIGDKEGTDLQSPTYSLVQEKGNMLHADLYRLESPEDLIHLELELYLEHKKYFLVEWGKEYLSALQRETGDNFNFFELEILVNPGADGSSNNSTRNYILRDIN